MAVAAPFLTALSSVASVYSAVKGSKTPKIQKPKEQADPNSLKKKRQQERSLASRYSGGREDTQLSENNTLG